MTRTKSKYSKLPGTFALVFVILLVCFYFFYNSELNKSHLQPVVLNLQAQLGTFLINLFDSSVSVHGNVIHGNSFSMELSKGCDGIEVTALLLAGILAFPSNWKEKFKGLFWGVSIIALLNILRIPLLYWAGSRISTELFDLIHVQGGFIFFVSVTILIWAYWIINLINQRQAELKIG